MTGDGRTMVKSGVKKVDANIGGVWVIDLLGFVFVRLGTYGDTQTSGNTYSTDDYIYRFNVRDNNRKYFESIGAVNTNMERMIIHLHVYNNVNSFKRMVVW